jgi:uncharacterized protein YjbI with pentapeptide repeats
LREARLFKANLSQTSFEGAILWDADLRETLLHGTDFRFANLHGADFSGAKCKNVRFPSPSDQRSHLIGLDLEREGAIQLDAWTLLLPGTHDAP